MRKYILAAALAAALAVCPVIMTGCGNKDDAGTSVSEEESKGIEWALASIKSWADVQVTVSEHESFNELNAVVNANNIKGELFTDTTTCAEFEDGLFDATYDVKGENIENAVFHIIPSRQKTDDFAIYGMNYFELIQKVSTKWCKEVDVKYKDLTCVKGQQGEFEILLYPADKDLSDKLGYSMLKIKGDTGEKESDITVSMTKDGFSFESTKQISVTVERFTGEKDESGGDVSVMKEYKDVKVFEYSPEDK